MKNLLKQWDPKFEDAEVTLLLGGIWRVRLGNEVYVLKHRSTRTRVWEEYDLMNWLVEKKQPISQLLYTNKDVPWAEYEGSIYVLYPYVEGIPGDQLGKMDAAYAREVGASLARLHKELALYEATEAFPAFDLFHEVASFAWPTVQGYLAAEFRNRLQDVEHGISRQLINPYEALPRQLIHRDFHPGNLIFKDGNLVGILDFDRVRIGIRVFDLCYLATAVLAAGFNDPKGRDSWFSFVQDLIEGYRSVQPLTKTEGYSFLYIVYLIQVLFIAYHLDAGNTDLADLNIAMLLWLNDQHDYLEPLIDKTVSG